MEDERQNLNHGFQAGQPCCWRKFLAFNKCIHILQTPERHDHHGHHRSSWVTLDQRITKKISPKNGDDARFPEKKHFLFTINLNQDGTRKTLFTEKKGHIGGKQQSITVFPVHSRCDDLAFLILSSWLDPDFFIRSVDSRNLASLPGSEPIALAILAAGPSSLAVLVTCFLLLEECSEWCDLEEPELDLGAMGWSKSYIVGWLLNGFYIGRGILTRAGRWSWPIPRPAWEWSWGWVRAPCRPGCRPPCSGTCWGCPPSWSSAWSGSACQPPSPCSSPCHRACAS